MTMTPQQALQRTLEGREIFHDEMLGLMRQIMAGEVSPVMTAAILTGLRAKNETIGEIAAAASVMRELSAKVSVPPPHDHLLDVVGTGGDGIRTFNISTATIFVAAAGGARVAKHGNRSVSSSSGSADVLEALGVNLSLSPEAVAQCVAETGVGFMFAPNHHSAMKNVGPVRKEMGVRTLFNILGPLTNPASAPNTLMGVYSEPLVGVQARVMQRLGARHVLVVHGRDGMDEVTLGAGTLVAELRDGAVREYEIHPEDYDLAMSSARRLVVDNAEESRQVILNVLDDKPGPAREIVIFNAGVALYAADLVDSIGSGVLRARELISSGAARARLEAFVRLSQTLGANS